MLHHTVLYLVYRVLTNYQINILQFFKLIDLKYGPSNALSRIVQMPNNVKEKPN